MKGRWRLLCGMLLGALLLGGCALEPTEADYERDPGLRAWEDAPWVQDRLQRRRAERIKRYGDDC